jgi:hypothetical protein
MHKLLQVGCEDLVAGDGDGIRVGDALFDLCPGAVERAEVVG